MLEFLSGKATADQLALRFGVQPSTVLRWRDLALEAVEASMRQGSGRSVQELEAGIRRVVGENVGWGVRKVWAVLRRDALVASRKRVWALMHLLGMVLPPVRERRDLLPLGQVVTATSNRRWSTDLTTVWTRQDGLVAVVPVVDCGDREILSFAVSKSQEAPVVLRPVVEALVNEFGSPDAVPAGLELRSDHGPQYNGADCEALCRAWGLEHTFAPVGRPTGNAVAERVILTLKVEFVWTRDWESIAELEAAIREWVEKYNTRRPHQALRWQTPAERRVENLGAKLAA